ALHEALDIHRGSGEAGFDLDNRQEIGLRRVERGEDLVLRYDHIAGLGVPALYLHEAEVPGRGAAFDVPALLFRRDIARLETHVLLGCHHRSHRLGLNLGARVGVVCEADRRCGLRRLDWRTDHAGWYDQGRTLQNRRQRRDLPLAIEFFLAEVQALDETL